MAVECETNGFFIVQGDDLNRVEVALRDTPAKNNQQNGTRLASDHSIDLLFPDMVMVGGTGLEPVTPAM